MIRRGADRHQFSSHLQRRWWFVEDERWQNPFINAKICRQKIKGCHLGLRPSQFDSIPHEWSASFGWWQSFAAIGRAGRVNCCPL